MHPNAKVNEEIIFPTQESKEDPSSNLTPAPTSQQEDTTDKMVLITHSDTSDITIGSVPTLLSKITTCNETLVLEGNHMNDDQLVKQVVFTVDRAVATHSHTPIPNYSFPARSTNEDEKK